MQTFTHKPAERFLNDGRTSNSSDSFSHSTTFGTCFCIYLSFSFPLSIPSSPPGQKEPPYLTEAGREAFDQLYRLWEGEMRNMLCSHPPSPLLPLPLDCQTQLVKDLLNVLIGVASVTFPLNEVITPSIAQENRRITAITPLIP